MTKHSAQLLIFLIIAFPAQARDDIGGSFSLQTGVGKVVTDENLQGTPFLIYFGFTSCPHICPTDLSKMAWLAERAKAELDETITPIFVTIDPARDNGIQLDHYVQQFHPSFVALTGPDSAIRAITDKYHVYYKAIPTANAEYTMDHSTFLFLMDAQGKYIAHFGGKLNRQQVWSELQQHLQ